MKFPNTHNDLFLIILKYRDYSNQIELENPKEKCMNYMIFRLRYNKSDKSDLITLEIETNMRLNVQ